jgi:recombination protein RecA
VEKTGAWYSYQDERIGQGRENAKEFLKEHPEVRESIEKEIMLRYHQPSDSSDDSEEQE